MKWRNIDTGPGYYYITGTVTEWLPLLARDDIRKAVCFETKVALRRSKADVAAYVIMPEHLHMVVHLPGTRELHEFCKCWRGRSGRAVVDLLKRRGDWETLEVLSRHANGRSNYALWKEQPRALAMFDEEMLTEKISYIHMNPVRRGLVEDQADWSHSSFRFYESGTSVDFPIVPPC
jgi:REP element-mobilizing transposase RayT